MDAASSVPHPIIFLAGILCPITCLAIAILMLITSRRP